MSCTQFTVRAVCLKIESNSDIELFSRERTASDTGSVCLDDTDSLANHLGWNAETSANTANGCRRGGDVGEGSKVDIEHECIGTFDQDTFAVGDSFMDVRNRVDDIGLETFSENLAYAEGEQLSRRTAEGMMYLVSLDFALGVVLEVTISFETTFNNLAEFLSEGFVIEEVVYSKTRSRSLGRVSRTNTFLGGTNAIRETCVNS